MAFRQITTPNLGVSATRGWCLKYVDDSINAPSRTPTAQACFNREKANGTVRAGDPPVGLWTPIFFSLNKGVYAGLGHVAWAYNHGNGWIEIHDSETRPGARAVYRNINEVLAWFGAYAPTYLGWSLFIDGRQIIEEYTPPTTPQGNLIAAKGTATVQVDALNVRNEPNRSATVVAVYSKGQQFNYDSYIIADGHVWLSYKSYSGVRRYIAEGMYDGNSNNVWVSGGVG